MTAAEKRLFDVRGMRLDLTERILREAASEAAGLSGALRRAEMLERAVDQAHAVVSGSLDAVEVSVVLAAREGGS